MKKIAPWKIFIILMLKLRDSVHILINRLIPCAIVVKPYKQLYSKALLDSVYLTC